MIIEVPEGERVRTPDDFYWLTLGQLSELLQEENVVNMDSRTVLSCIRFAKHLPGRGRGGWNQGGGPANFQEAVLASALAGETDSVNDFDTLISWMTELKSRYRLAGCGKTEVSEAKCFPRAFRHGY